MINCQKVTSKNVKTDIMLLTFLKSGRIWEKLRECKRVQESARECKILLRDSWVNWESWNLSWNVFWRGTINLRNNHFTHVILHATLHFYFYAAQVPLFWCFINNDIRENVFAHCSHLYFLTCACVCRCARRLERSANARLQYEHS